jgi:hypothetical protein
MWNNLPTFDKVISDNLKFISWGGVGSLQEDKADGAWRWASSSVEVKNTWSFTSSHTYIYVYIMTTKLGKSITFILSL